jgi:hypothetical protein
VPQDDAHAIERELRFHAAFASNLTKLSFQFALVAANNL